MLPKSDSRLRDRNGAVIAFVAILLFVFLGMAALAVDFGMLLGARTEAQRSADAGALAGATILLSSPTGESIARTTASDWAGRNTVRGATPTVIPDQDVDVDTGLGIVRVRVLRTIAHAMNEPMQNFFARAIGVPTSDVSASAAAQVRVAGAVNCPLPFLLTDRFWVTGEGRLAGPNDPYGPSDIYNEGGLSDEQWAGGPDRPTGYGTADLGRVLGIRPGSPGEAVPSVYNPLRIDDSSGFAPVREWIAGCPNPDAVFSRGQEVDIQTGAGIGPTRQGFQDLIGQDPTAFWGTRANSPNAPPARADSPGGCVMRPGDVDVNGNLVCVSSPRVKPMMTINPIDTPTSPGMQSVTLQNFTGVFVVCLGNLQPNQQGCTGNFTPQNGSIWVRFVGVQGLGGLAPGVDDGSLARSIQLIE